MTWANRVMSSANQPSSSHQSTFRSSAEYPSPVWRSPTLLLPQARYGHRPRRSPHRGSADFCAARWNTRHGSWRSDSRTAYAMLTHGSAFRHSAGCPVFLQAAPARNHLPASAGTPGGRLRSVATKEDQSYLTAKAVTWLRENFEKTLNVDELASMAGMSRSTLHHHFRGLTAMSPLQFQKQLRLRTARQKMLIEELDAASAAFAVGYESPSQFNREYKRFFGKPPMRDVQALRASL